ncbi:MAG: GNAT family N-acetyltransferase [bacterium]|jgi:RimJ/RimL family protein N-acetyltransferase
MLKLEGNNIYLRPVRPSDAESIYRYARHREISRYTYVPYPYRLEDSYAFLKSLRRWRKKGTSEVFGIIDKSSHRLLGLIGMHRIDRVNRRVEIGYWLGKEHWGKGFTSDAVRLVVRYAFKDMKLQKVVARVWHPNIASAKLLQKCGFKLEGRLRRQTFRNNRWYDELMFGILKQEFKVDSRKQ